MTTKREWRKRAKAAEAALVENRLPPPLTFDQFTVCFPDRTISKAGAVIHIDTNCVTFPLTNQEHLLAPAGYYPLFPRRAALSESRP